VYLVATTIATPATTIATTTVTATATTIAATTNTTTAIVATSTIATTTAAVATTAVAPAPTATEAATALTRGLSLIHPYCAALELRLIQALYSLICTTRHGHKCKTTWTARLAVLRNKSILYCPILREELLQVLRIGGPGDIANI
jgi:hypothetical protein